MAVKLGIIDYETYSIMDACHRAYERARTDADRWHAGKLNRSVLKRKMAALGHQDFLDGRPVRQERELAEHFDLMDRCTLSEMTDYHGAYLTGFNDALQRAG
ncbi:hypothetical protein ACWEJ6_52295 [Nonomuraea sp. NPDC004702]